MHLLFVLGNERQFNAKYTKPIVNSRGKESESKSVSKENKEAGVLAMEALHRQVLPFILRRMKEDVLKDLPPKITQDYYCDLSPIQKLLYEDFAKEQKDKKEAKTHIFQVRSTLDLRNISESYHSDIQRSIDTRRSSGLQKNYPLS